MKKCMEALLEVALMVGTVGCAGNSSDSEGTQEEVTSEAS